MNAQLRNKVLDIIQQEFPDVEIHAVDRDMPIREVISLDSIQYVSILSKIENTLKIEIPIRAMDADTLNDFLSVFDDIE